MGKKEQTYIIPMTRIGIGYRDIEVKATSQREAEEKALDEAGNHEYSENSSDYIISTKASEQIVNVIERNGDQILHITSFLLKNTYFEKELVNEAEQLFAKKAQENGAKVDDLASYIEDGIYKKGTYSVYLTWSDDVSSK